ETETKVVTSTVYPDGYNEEAAIRGLMTGQPLVVHAAVGWTAGFDRVGTYSPPSGVSVHPMLSDYLYSAFDYDESKLPVSTDCNTYRFLRDGHAEILLTGVSAYTRVYTYVTPEDGQGMGIAISGGGNSSGDGWKTLEANGNPFVRNGQTSLGTPAGATIH